MRASVRAAFCMFTEPLEGVTRWFYLDLKGLVTIGLGNLVDPVEAALDLQMMRADGATASRADIRAAWGAVKAKTEWRLRGGLIYRAIPENDVRLTQTGLDSLVQGKLDQVDLSLARRFDDAYVRAPADAQLAVLSMAWAAGAAFRYPILDAALRAQDYRTCADECTLTPNLGTIVHRNAANRTLFLNANIVHGSGLDPDVLYWPEALSVPPRPADEGVLGPAA